MRIAIFAALGALFLATAAFAEPDPEKVMTPPVHLQWRLVGGAFDELETIANYERTSGARYLGGAAPILNFYEVLALFNQGDERCVRTSPFTFEEKREALERWKAAKPESPTPKIALARLWQQFASAARGCDPAHTVSDEQWLAQKEGLRRARDMLRDVDHEIDPGPYEIEMGALEIEEHPHERLISLYERATRAFPNETSFAAIRYRYSLPRWYGSPGESAEFARSLLTTPGGDDGLNAYFDVARTVLSTDNRFDKVLTESGIDYKTLAKAFASRVARFGAWSGDMNVMLYYAVAAADCDTVDLMGMKIADAWDPSIWHEESYYRDALRWARQQLVITWRPRK